MRINFATFFFIIWAIEIGNAQLTKLVQLAPISIYEELRQVPQKLFDFSELFSTDPQLNRVQLIRSDEKQQSRVTGADSERFYFIIDAVLYTNLTFDREKMLEDKSCLPQNSTFDCLIKLRIAGYDDNNNLIKIFTLPVSILDVNDNQPEFKHDTYKVNISENLNTKSSIPLESPIDLDSPKFGVQRCNIDKDMSQFEVSFNKHTQRLFLHVNPGLDREEKASYEMDLVCTDGIGVTRTKIFIDVLDTNDNSPVFKQSSFSLNVEEFDGLNEDDEIEIGKVEAVDKDDPNSPNGQVIYSIPGELNDIGRDLFSIDQLTGVLKIKRSPQLDFETRRDYLIKVKAQDKGPNAVAAYAEIRVNVLDKNDNAPIAHLTLVEKYLIRQDESNNTIWINEEIDFAKSVTLAYLTISDADSFATNGDSLRAFISSIAYTPPNSRLATLEDSTSTFQLKQIVQDQESSYYALHLTGRLDREKVAFYDLVIQCEDNANNMRSKMSGEVRLRIILVDINDNKPRFTQSPSYTVLVDENVASMNFAQVSAEDPDLDQNGAIVYEILTGRDSNLFRVDPDTGLLSLNIPLDRELKEKYTFAVRASDMSVNKLSSEVKVNVIVLDKNDNTPKFTKERAEFVVEENCKVGSLVGNVKAVDIDLRPSTGYRLSPLVLAKYFHVDNRTGDLLTNSELDAESIEVVRLLNVNDTFEFEISAVDLDSGEFGNKIKVQVKLSDVNDNSPLIIQPENRVLTLNLRNKSRNCESSIDLLTKVRALEKDRDTARKANETKATLFKINSIRRLGWQLVHEIYRRNRTNATKFLENLLDAQNSKPSPKVNLRQMFAVEPRDETEFIGDGVVTSADLILSQSCKLNLGVIAYFIRN